MDINVAVFVRKHLPEWELTRVYGYPGDGVCGLGIALERVRGFMLAITPKDTDLGSVPENPAQEMIAIVLSHRG